MTCIKAGTNQRRCNEHAQLHNYAARYGIDHLSDLRKSSTSSSKAKYYSSTIRQTGLYEDLVQTLGLIIATFILQEWKSKFL